MKDKKYEIILAAVIAARATSFIFSKMVLKTMSPFNLLTVRFLLAFTLLVIVFWKRLLKLSRYDLASGFVCGAIFFLIMTCEYTALKTTASGTVSLLENCSIVFVPFFETLLLRRLPPKLTIISALTAMTGVFCLTMHGGGSGGGAFFALLAAVFYAIGIIVTSIVSRKAKDTLCIGIVQVGALGFLALAASVLFETPHMPTNTAQWLMLLALSVVCTSFGYTLQPVAQRYVSAQRTGLLCAINPAIASILGAVVLHERFGALNLLGLAFVLFSIVLPYMKRPRGRIWEGKPSCWERRGRRRHSASTV